MNLSSLNTFFVLLISLHNNVAYTQPIVTPAAINEDTRSVLRSAEALFEKGDLTQAADILREALPGSLHHRGPENAQQLLVIYGVVLHSANDVQDALQAYEEALELRQMYMHNSSNGFLKSNIGRALWQLGRYDEAVKILKEAVAEGEQMAARTWNNLGLALHYSGQETAALHAYTKALEVDASFGQGEIYFNTGVTLKQLGKVEEAAQTYRKAIELNPLHAEAKLNLAALYHEFLVFHDAMALYKEVLTQHDVAARSKLMAALNLGVALTEQGNAREALEYFEMVLKLWDGQDDFDLLARANIILSRIVVNDWRYYEREIGSLIAAVSERQLKHGLTTSHLPFDTLLVPCDKAYRLQVAMSHAHQYETAIESIPSPINFNELQVAYFSFDFNNHPTAHLVEALFHLHNRSKVRTHALSFGKDDGSEYRERIKQSADEFHDIVLKSHDQSVALMREDIGVHILMDMQGFTRGGRPEIVAQRPAPIIVNYLVFPGTSGASFVDYIIVDSTVVPPEHAKFFSEKTVYMPNCYQINYYSPHLGYDYDDSSTGHVSVMPRRRERPPELPHGTFVFCNFNKNDKLEPRTWDLWMRILRSVPNSVLWLLEPSRRLAPEMMKETLRSEALSRGVDPERIVFAPRVSKGEHLSRHIYADLFIDTVIYGAHSTATDALRSGLPVLTLVGDVMPNRVAASLLKSLDHKLLYDVLCAFTEDDFVNTAVLVGRRKSLSSVLKAELEHHLTNREKVPPLFNAQAYTKDLERGMRVMWELFRIGSEPAHIALLS